MTHASDPGHSDPLRGLRAARELMERMGPQPLAVWVVDAPWAAAVIRRAYAARGFGSEYPGPAAGQTLAGPLPMFEWRNTPAPTAAEHDRMLKTGRWFVRWPGLWLEMSDGRPWLFAVTTHDEAQTIAAALLGSYQGRPEDLRTRDE